MELELGTIVYHVSDLDNTIFRKSSNEDFIPEPGKVIQIVDELSCRVNFLHSGTILVPKNRLVIGKESFFYYANSSIAYRAVVEVPGFVSMNELFLSTLGSKKRYLYNKNQTLFLNLNKFSPYFAKNDILQTPSSQTNVVQQASYISGLG
jgi:hypothetical protein